MSDFQITGLSSGIDWGNIIDTMMENKKAVQKQWESEQKTIDDKISLYKELDVYMEDLRETLDPLERESTFMNKSAEITTLQGAESFISMEVAPEAEIEEYNIEVIDVALNHRVASDRVDDTASALGHEGSFSLSSGEFSVDMDISAGQSLEDIVTAINSAVEEKASEEGIERPFSASIMDNTLILSSSNTGSDYSITSSDPDGILQDLGVLDSEGAFAREIQAARDASLSVDGLSITRSSNKIDDLISGVTLELHGQGSAKAEVVLDAEQAVSSVKSMVEAYNAAMDWINIKLSEKPVEDPQSDIEERWGLLKGDTMLWSAKQEMRRTVSKPRYDMQGEFRTLSSIGIETESANYGKSGKLEFDESAFMEGMLKDPASVQDLLNSMASEMKVFADNMSSDSSINVGGVSAVEGKIPNRIDSLERRSDDIDERITDFNARLEMERASLEALYSNMETTLAKLSEQSSYLGYFSSVNMSGNNNG
jgi:flagellar hook-associated protein 2